MIKKSELYNDINDSLTLLFNNKYKNEIVKYGQEFYDVVNNVVNDIMETEYRKYLGK